MWTNYNVNKNRYETWGDSVTLLSSITILILHVLRFESGYQLIDQPFTSPQYVVQALLIYLCIEQLTVVAIVCPKILKIMPVDACNASIILKC